MWCTIKKLCNKVHIQGFIFIKSRNKNKEEVLVKCTIKKNALIELIESNHIQEFYLISIINSREKNENHVSKIY